MEQAMPNFVSMEAAAAYRLIFEVHCEVRAIAVVWYDRQPQLMQERSCLNDAESRVIERGLQLRATTGMPFWEAVMLSLFEESESTPNLLQAALFHQSRRGRETVLSREEVLKGRLEDLVWACGSTSALSVLSEVQLSGGRIGHLPFLDFHCPVAENSLRLVTNVARILFSGPGIILDSGHSYHAVGLNIVDTERLIDILARALLFNPIVDRAYISHQIIERGCALRISRGGHQDKTPVVVAQL